jgi:hypothetical protein
MQATTLSPIATRFAWKEYRTLRGLWLAVLVLGVLVQLVLMLLAAPGADVPAITFAAAWGAAVLYAIGAAAILFSVEHEDGTYDFLAGLPTRWLPLYLGKLCVAAASAVAAALVLMLAGWVIAGGRWPALQNFGEILGLLGFGVLEALAWGTLFSLLLKRPLVAVLWTIVVSAVAVHWAVITASSSTVASMVLMSYSEAIPLRLAIVALVFVASAVAARRWLAADRAQTAPKGDLESTAATAALPVEWPRAKPQLNTSRRYSHGSMLIRLLWQSCRDSWKMLLMPFLAAALLYAGILGIGGPFLGAFLVAWVAAPLALFLPSLYGALAFGADQRRANYRFLAEHAARPRYVWISRHTVWLGALVAIAVGLAIAGSISALVAFDRHLSTNANDRIWMSMQISASSVALELRQMVRFVGQSSLLAAFGILAAYGFGQLCSMLLRSEILAVFLAIILSVVLSAWAAVVAVWDLSVWAFLLPLFIGTMAATWLRAPDWLVDRNSWRAWWKPALAVVLPIVFAGLYLPVAREIPAKAFQDVAGWLPTEVYKSKAEKVPSGDTPEARKTASMYEHAFETMFASPEQNPVNHWNKPEYQSRVHYDALSDTIEPDNSGELPGTIVIDVAKIPADEQEAYQEALVALRAMREQNWHAGNEAIIEASHRPTCWFDVNWTATPVPIKRYAPFEIGDPQFKQREAAWRKSHPNYYRLLYLPLYVLDSGLPPDGVEIQLAAVRMLSHLREGQPTDVTIRTLTVEGWVLEKIVNWASKKATPTDQIRAVLDGLQEYFASAPLDPTASFAADDRIVRNVIRGKTQPLILAEPPIDNVYYLAYLANQLPWERRRALAALDMITMQNFRDAESLGQFIYGKNDYSYSTKLQNWIQLNRDPFAVLPDDWLVQQPTAATSYLARFEYLARVRVRDLFQQVLETETARRATVVRLALLLYRRDHGEYPTTLSKLFPKYVRVLPTDPFMGNTQALSYALVGRNAHVSHYRNDLIYDPGDTPLVWSAGVDTALISGDWESGNALIFPLPK